MLISKVELPVSDAVEAARFYGDVLGLPTRTSGGVVEVEVAWPYYCHCRTATRREVAGADRELPRQGVLRAFVLR